jgi:pre-mRNA-splicing helicase BRR2
LDEEDEDDEGEDGEEGDEGDRAQEDREEGKEQEIEVEEEEQEGKAAEEKQQQDKDLIDLGQIDAQWLNRTLGEAFKESMAEEILELETRVMKILSLENPRECEKRLFGVLGVEKFELIRILVKNKWSVFFGSRLQQAQSESEREAIKREMEQSREGRALLD